MSERDEARRRGCILMMVWTVVMVIGVCALLYWLLT